VLSKVSSPVRLVVLALVRAYRLRANACVANQESQARSKQQCDGCRQPRAVRLAYRPGDAAVPPGPARLLSAWQTDHAGLGARVIAFVERTGGR
jgi:hypothetical protein